MKQTAIVNQKQNYWKIYLAFCLGVNTISLLQAILVLIVNHVSEFGWNEVKNETFNFILKLKIILKTILYKRNTIYLA